MTVKIHDTMDSKEASSKKHLENGDSSSSPEKSKADADVIEDVDPDASLKCGYCSWRPDCLQGCNTPRMLLACMCWYTFTHGFVVNGIIYVDLSPWERLYELESTQTAWIVSSYDISAAIFTLFFGYIGQFMHNGIILATSGIALACGSFLMLMPHILSGLYEMGPLPAEICDASGNSTFIDCTGESSSAYYWFLIAGQVLHGVGGGALYTLGIPYMDDQIKIKNTPVYIGIMLSFAALGPAMGYICGGLFLSIYVDTDRSDSEIDLEPSDPRWVGAWWIGLLYSGLAGLTVAVLMACFPRELPSAKKNKAERKSQAHKGAGDAETAREDFGKSARDIWITVKYLFTNPVWVFLTISGAIESGAVTGFAAFLPKVIQFQFSKTPSEAAIYAGLVVVPGAAGGQILGGLIPKWLNLKMRGLLLQCVISGVIGLVISFQFLLRCRTPSIAGVTVPYYNSTQEASFDYPDPDVYHECNTHCNCTTSSYDPVCGSDSIEYFSPCFAACTRINEENGNKVYYDCSCIESNNSSASKSAEGGICSVDCDIFILFMFLFLCINLCTFISSTSGQAATIRSVPDKQRAFANGVQRTIIRLLGNVPGSILFGLVFDASCIIWQESCDERGSCWIYDSQFVATGIFYTCIVVKGVASLGFLLALCLYKPPPEDDKLVEKDIDVDNHPEKGVENGGMTHPENATHTHL